MAGIGDEIDAHALRGIIACLVDQMHDARSAGSDADMHLPALVERTEPDQVDRPL